MGEAAGGYTGRCCIVDLSRGTTEALVPGAAFYRRYLGGGGLGAAVIMERQPAGVDPMAPESHLGFCAGLLTATGAFFSGRLMVVGKSPLTGGWGDAGSAGAFSVALKRAGHDGLFFTGTAPEPVWVLIGETRIEIRDAADLWGLDIPATEERIREILGDPKVQVASIGQAGERCSLMAGIGVDKDCIAARAGLGAVMGAKRLKAVAISGRGKVPVAHRDRIKAVNRTFLAEFKKSRLVDRLTARCLNPLAVLVARSGIRVPANQAMLREVLRRHGTTGLTAYAAMVGGMPIDHWPGVGLKGFPRHRGAGRSDERVTGRQKRRHACRSCPLGCGGSFGREGRFAGETGRKPSYETLGAFGGMLGGGDLESIIQIGEMCNRAGIDAISTGAAVTFAIQCFQHGLIGVRDTEGLVLDGGRSAQVVALTEKIIRREGIGDLLADGVGRAAARIGAGARRFAAQAGGRERPMHEAPCNAGFVVACQCEPTPGPHTGFCYRHAGLFEVEKQFPAARRFVRQAPRGEGREVRRYAAASFYMQLLNCAGICPLGALCSRLPMAAYLNAATGWDLAADEYLGAGERILSLRRAFDVREGLRVRDRRAVVGEPLASGPPEGGREDVDRLQDEFFRAVGWDPVLGGPGPEKIRALGLEALVGG